MWANQGATELRWSVPGAVDVAAAATTGTALIGVAILAHANRRRSWAIDVNRHRPAAEGAPRVCRHRRWLGARGSREGLSSG